MGDNDYDFNETIFEAHKKLQYETRQMRDCSLKDRLQEIEQILVTR